MDMLMEISKFGSGSPAAQYDYVILDVQPIGIFASINSVS
jgi:hypothetical protein